MAWSGHLKVAACCGTALAVVLFLLGQLAPQAIHEALQQGVGGPVLGMGWQEGRRGAMPPRRRNLARVPPLHGSQIWADLDKWRNMQRARGRACRQGSRFV